jgi:hypothetical protein
MTAIEAPFAIGDIVETIKGAKFWGEVVSCYRIPSSTPGYIGPDEWRADVRAVAPDFLGTIHVYPTVQLSLRAAEQQEPVAWQWSDGNSIWYTVDANTNRIPLDQQEHLARVIAADKGGLARPLFASPPPATSDRIEAAVKALEEIVAPTQTRDFAWWQTRIREVIAGLRPSTSEGADVS